MKQLTASTLVILFSFITTKGISQVTDSDIAKSLLGRNHYDVNNTLDSLGVWYHQHLPQRPGTNRAEELKSFAEIYSITDGKGSVKVYILKLKEEKWINEILINFRHDSKEQVEDIAKVSNPSDYHIGTYSTDIIFKWKKSRAGN